MNFNNLFSNFSWPLLCMQLVCLIVFFACYLWTVKKKIFLLLIETTGEILQTTLRSYLKLYNVKFFSFFLQNVTFISTLRSLPLNNYFIKNPGNQVNADMKNYLVSNQSQCWHERLPGLQLKSMLTWKITWTPTKVNADMKIIWSPTKGNADMKNYLVSNQSQCWHEKLPGLQPKSMLI